MRNRQPITPEKVYNSLEQMSEDQARANSGYIMRPFDNAMYISATSQVLDHDEFNSIKQEEDFFTNTQTLRGIERRMHLLGTVSTKTFVVPEQLPKKPEQLPIVMASDAMAKIAVAQVSIVSMYPILPKAEHATQVRIAVTPNTLARQVAAQGVAAFLNGGEGLLTPDAIADFDERLRLTRQMAGENNKRTYDFLQNSRFGRSRR